jgi:hypothetical protein
MIHKSCLQVHPRDKDAVAKFRECEKEVKAAAFAAAIQTEETMPLSETINLDKIGACVVVGLWVVGYIGGADIIHLSPSLF